MTKPKKVSRTQEMLEWLVENGHTPEVSLEAINRFVDGTMKGEYVSDEDKLQVAAVLVALMNGVWSGDDMNVQLRQILHLRKVSAGKFNFNPKKAYPGSQAYDIVKQHVRGEITRVDAVDKFTLEIFKDEKNPPDARQIERWIATMKPRVKKDIERLESSRLFWETLKKELSTISDK